jgi:uncharacterized coiled-coil protein SlyX
VPAPTGAAPAVPVEPAPELTPSLFGLTHVAFGLGDSHRAEDNERAARQWDVIAELNRQLHDSRKSEYALLLQLETVVNQLEELRRQTQGIASVVAMLRLRRSGRLILWVLRASLRTARKLRRSAVGRRISRVRRKL